VFPEAYDFLKVICWVEEKMLPPFIPIQRHSSIHINTGEQRTNERRQVGLKNNVLCGKVTMYCKLNG